MRRRLLQTSLLLAIGVIFWHVVARQTSSGEPWDASFYWTAAYPALLVISGAAGIMLRSYGWLAGVLLTFAQLPAILNSNGTEASWPLALLLLSALALPPTAVSALAGWIAARMLARRNLEDRQDRD